MGAEQKFSSKDICKLIGVYVRLCPDDLVSDDDPRRVVIAREVLEVGRAASVDEAITVIRWWGQSDEWNRYFVRIVRGSVRRMKFDFAV